MSAFFSEFDPASFAKPVGVTAQSGVAAGTGDNTELTSDAIDTKPVGAAGYNNLLLVIAYLTTVAQNQTLKVTIKIADSADGSNFGSDTTLVSAATIEGSTTAATTAKKAAYELGLSLSAYRRWVRFKITMDLSAGSADTFVYGAAAILGGADRLPV